MLMQYIHVIADTYILPKIVSNTKVLISLKWSVLLNNKGLGDCVGGSAEVYRAGDRYI